VLVNFFLALVRTVPLAALDKYPQSVTMVRMEVYLRSRLFQFFAYQLLLVV